MSPTMKPFQIALLAGFGMLALIGLFLFANYGGFSGSRTGVGTVAIWGTLPQSSMDAVLSGLKGDQDFVGVSYLEVPEEEFDQRLTEALAVGQGPDLVLISQEMLATEQAKLSTIPYATISEREFVDAYVPLTELFMGTDGIYGIPFAIDPLVLFYNRTLLAQAGVPQPPSTWEAVLSLAERMTVRQGNAIAVAAIPFGAYGNGGNARASLSLLLLQAGVPIVAPEGGALRSQLARAGEESFGATPAQAAIAFYTQFADAAKSVYTWNPALPPARDAFIAGDLAFYPGFASELAFLQASNPNLDFDIAPMPQPQATLANPRGTRITYGRAYALAIPRATPNAAGALRVALALADPALAPQAAATLGMAPALRAALADTSQDRYAPIVRPAALIARGWLSPDPATTDRIFSTMVGNVASGRLPIGEALVAADQALDAALNP